MLSYKSRVDFSSGAFMCLFCLILRSYPLFLAKLSFVREIDAESRSDLLTKRLLTLFLQLPSDYLGVQGILFYYGERGEGGNASNQHVEQGTLLGFASGPNHK